MAVSRLTGKPALAKLISFDIDGTLEVGEPPGSVTMEMVREVQKNGFLIGSCSDRTISSQRRIWREHGIAVDFTVLKQQLGDLITQFEAEEYIHIGDTELDSRVAEEAGFSFVPTDDAPRWLRGPLTGEHGGTTMPPR